MAALRACARCSASTPTQGRRYSWGYPAVPEQSEHLKVEELLDLAQIGMTHHRRLRARPRAVDARARRPPPAGDLLRHPPGPAAARRQPRRPDPRLQPRPLAVRRARRRRAARGRRRRRGRARDGGRGRLARRPRAAERALSLPARAPAPLARPRGAARRPARGDPACASAPSRGSPRRQRLGEVEALAELAVHPLQARELLGFSTPSATAFRLKIRASSTIEAVICSTCGVRVGEERAVDLEDVDGQLAHVVERGVAGAEVVDRQFHARAPRSASRRSRLTSMSCIITLSVSSSVRLDGTIPVSLERLGDLVDELRALQLARRRR